MEGTFGVRIGHRFWLQFRISYKLFSLFFRSRNGLTITDPSVSASLTYCMFEFQLLALLFGNGFFILKYFWGMYTIFNFNIEFLSGRLRWLKGVSRMFCFKARRKNRSLEIHFEHGNINAFVMCCLIVCRKWPFGEPIRHLNTSNKCLQNMSDTPEQDSVLFGCLERDCVRERERKRKIVSSRLWYDAVFNYVISGVSGDRNVFIFTFWTAWSIILWRHQLSKRLKVSTTKRIISEGLEIEGHRHANLKSHKYKIRFSSRIRR